MFSGIPSKGARVARPKSGILTRVSGLPYIAHALSQIIRTGSLALALAAATTQQAEHTESEQAYRAGLRNGLRRTLAKVASQQGSFRRGWRRSSAEIDDTPGTDHKAIQGIGSGAVDIQRSVHEDVVCSIDRVDVECGTRFHVDVVREFDRPEACLVDISGINGAESKTRQTGASHEAASATAVLDGNCDIIGLPGNQCRRADGSISAASLAGDQFISIGSRQLEYTVLIQIDPKTGIVIDLSDLGLVKAAKRRCEFPEEAHAEGPSIDASKIGRDNSVSCVYWTEGQGGCEEALRSCR